MRACGWAVIAAGIVIGAPSGGTRVLDIRAVQDVSPVRQTADDPDLQAAVERFYAAQEAEDIDAYLALWSSRAQRPQRAQLEFVFKSGDDKFNDITLHRVAREGNRARVRVSLVRERTRTGAPPLPDALRVTTMNVGLTFVREEGSWKLWREGTPATDLAGALMDAASPAERDALMAAEPDLLGAGLLNAISQRAADAAQRSFFADAGVLYTLAIEIARKAGDLEAEGEALQNLANTFYFRSLYPDALAAYERRLAIERERRDDAAIASAILGIATVRYAYAEYGKALEAYREALAIQEQLTDAPALATTLISTGNVLYLQGDYDAAIVDYRRGLSISRERGNADAQMRALEGLGRVFTAQGDFAGALAAFFTVLEQAKERNDRSKHATALQYVGEIHFKLGNLEEARTAYETSRAHYEAIKDAANAGRLWQAIALTDLAAGRFEVAEKEYARSIAVCTGARDEECVARATVGVAFAQNAQQKYTQSIASYGKAIDAFTAQGRREDAARASVGLAQALAGKGELDAALDAAVQARRSAVVISADDVLWRAMVTEARIQRKRRDGAAMSAAQAAVETVQRLQQLANERPGTYAPWDGDAAFATLSLIQVEEGDAAAALATAEQLRLYRLRLTLGPSEREIARGMTAAEREEERAAAAQLASLGAQLARERGLPKPDAARLARLEEAQVEALARRDVQQRTLFERLPELRVWRGLGASATADDLHRVLADGSVFIEFVADEDDLVTFVGTRGESGVSLHAYVTPLDRRTLAERVIGLLQPASLRDRAEWNQRAAELMKRLPPDGVAAMANASTILIVPDAALWRVPFEALRVDDRYLAECATVLYSGSLTAMLHARERSPRGPATTLLAVAAPEIPASVKERMLQTSPGWTPRAADSAEQEVARLRRDSADQNDQPGDVLLLRSEATEARVRQRAAEVARLHFAVPFRVNAASPLFSPLLFAGNSAEPPNDGVLEARDVINLDLAASVVVLSDGSALAMRDAARALDAIEWTWRSAGVDSVLLARWPADASAAERLLEVFHARLAEGDTAADALGAARARVRGADAMRAPFSWAGWLLTAPPRRVDGPARQQADPERSRGPGPSRPGS